MTTDKDHLDLIGKARSGVALAEQSVTKVTRELKEAREGLVLAKQRLAEVLREVFKKRRQPLLPFEEFEDDPATPAHAPDPPLDRTHVWEQRVADPELKNVAGQDANRLREQITEYRVRDDRGRGFGLAVWGDWSEFDVNLADGSPVRVLAKPDWNGERYLHHIEFWSDHISPTKYWSTEIDHTRVGHPVKALAEWCREHIQRQTDEYQAERIVKPARVRKPKAVAQ